MDSQFYDDGEELDGDEGTGFNEDADFADFIDGLPNDLGDIFIPLGNVTLPETQDVYTDSTAKRFSLKEPDLSEFTVEELEALERLKRWNPCVICGDESTLCPKMWDHLAEAAMGRVMYICYAVMQLVSGSRGTALIIGADPENDLDLAVLSYLGELNLLRLLIPKLHSTQKGMDSE